jgi:hypothetical protein
VQTNTISGNLICFGNAPAAQVNSGDGGLPNVVGGKAIGECAGLTHYTRDPQNGSVVSDEQRPNRWRLTERGRDGVCHPGRFTFPVMERARSLLPEVEGRIAQASGSFSPVVEGTHRLSLRCFARSPPLEGRPGGVGLMHVVVVNRITLSVPVEEVVADIEREMPAIFAGLEGFVGQTLVKTGPQELVVVGPGAFNTWVAPRATGQDRAVGPVVSDIGWGS